jgi:leucine dehydrogenase
MSPFENREFKNHELVLFGNDEPTALRAIIAVHSTALGPAAGGCRMWPYESDSEAITDALRLSRGMSYKNAMADLPFGGGKSVIIGDSRRKTPALFEAFGRFIGSLGGRYITAEDVGTTTADMESVAKHTRFVTGLHRRGGEFGGDPSPKTALGVYLGIKAAVKFRMGRSDLEGLRIAVQGVGGVGYHLCRLLSNEGVELRVADVRATATDRVRDEFKAHVVPTETVLAEDVDVVAPCALGAVLHHRTIASMRARIVAGAANNQLAKDSDGIALLASGILYAPDYVINAGGIISATREYLGGSTESQVTQEIHGIPARLTDIFEHARRENRPTSLVADRMAQERIDSAQRRLVA